MASSAPPRSRVVGDGEESDLLAVRIPVDAHDYWLTHGGDAGSIINRKPSAEAGWDT